MCRHPANQVNLSVQSSGFGAPDFSKFWGHPVYSVSHTLIGPLLTLIGNLGLESHLSN